MKRWLGAAIALGLAPLGGLAQEASVGRPIAAVVDELRASGLPLAYGTALLPPSLTVRAVPLATEPLELVREILAPHGLTLRLVDGLYIVVRADDAAAAEPPTATLTITVRDEATGGLIAAPTVEGTSSGLAVETLRDGRLLATGAAQRRYGITLTAEGYAPRRVSLVVGGTQRELQVALVPLPVPEVVVTASRYELVRDDVTAPFYVDQLAIARQPDFGDDPLRALHRLPGAASGISAKTHLRGAELNETAVVLNGQRLLDPFHIRDYQSMFSAIDVRAIDGMEVYTGGFPVRYGDSMGALVIVDAIEPHEPRHSELGLSVLNTSVLSAGTIGDGTGSWLVSGRRGNLEDVIQERLGEPSYYDFFGELSVDFSARTHVSVNALTARDRVLLVTEADPTESQQSFNDTRNNTFWVHWQQQWSNGLTSSTTFSSSSFHSKRHATVDDPEKMVAAVGDRRDVAAASVRQDWTLDIGEAHTLSFGAEYNQESADYVYTASAEYFGFSLAFPSIAPTVLRDATLAPHGELFGAYVADRWQITAATTAELGLRLDRYGYDLLPNERHASPRFSVRHELGPLTALRWSIGRYFQSQRVHELQIEDGITTFHPAQRTDQTVIGIERRIGERYVVRAEAYRKSSRHLGPRFENLFDPLAILPELEPDRVRIAPAEATARGLELSVASADPDRLRWWASFVRARASDVVAGQTVPRSWDQRYAVQLGVEHDAANWDFAAVLAAHSGWPTTGLTLRESASNELTAVIGPRNAMRLGGFASLDLRVSRSVPLRIGALDVFVELSNATNHDNPCCSDYDIEADDDGVFLEQEIDTWLPRLATFGILWQF